MATAGRPPRFRVESLDARRWAIVDDSDLVVFAGNLSECEDWLDLRENLARRR